MKTPSGVKVIEFNCRFGDPETEVVLPRLESDIYDIFSAVADHTPMPEIKWKKEVTMGFVMASKGYPEKYEKGYEITVSPDVLPYVYVAGAKREGDALLTNGGRVLGVTAEAPTLKEALALAYARVEQVHFDNQFYRHDIGERAMKAGR